ncbi:MAG: CHRD domain-containing protein [Nitrospirae bacterium]|nr:CHRD domain-containing protein [Nitrospirota bacterium]
MKKIYPFIILLVAGLATLGIAAEKSFKATLSGGEETPPAMTAAKGEATFTLGKGGTELMYKVTVSGIENVTAAHIHSGKKGKEGPVVVVLYAGPKKEGAFSGTLSEGTVTGKDLKGSLAGKPLSALVGMIESGDAYVNVHTTKHPSGEIRGQIL